MLLSELFDVGNAFLFTLVRHVLFGLVPLLDFLTGLAFGFFISFQGLFALGEPFE